VAQTTDSGSTTAASILVWSAKWTPVELEPTFLPTYSNKLFPFFKSTWGRKALSNKVGPLWRNPNIKDMKVAMEIRGYYYDHLVPRNRVFYYGSRGRLQQRPWYSFHVGCKTLCSCVIWP
jgi:hypothetical protein